MAPDDEPLPELPPLEDDDVEERADEDHELEADEGGAPDDADARIEVPTEGLDELPDGEDEDDGPASPDASALDVDDIDDGTDDEVAASASDEGDVDEVPADEDDGGAEGPGDPLVAAAPEDLPPLEEDDDAPPPEPEPEPSDAPSEVDERPAWADDAWGPVDPGAASPPPELAERRVAVEIDGTLVSLLRRDDEARVYVVRTDEHGRATIIGEIDDDPEADVPLACAWDEARGWLWIAAGDALVALAPPPRTPIS